VHALEPAHKYLETAQHVGLVHHREYGRVARELIDERDEVTETGVRRRKWADDIGVDDVTRLGSVGEGSREWVAVLLAYHAVCARAANARHSWQFTPTKHVVHLVDASVPETAMPQLHMVLVHICTPSNVTARLTHTLDIRVLRRCRCNRPTR
jgi:hypothetical protein